MAVMSVMVLRLKPGRYDDFLKFHTQVEELWAKAGAQNQRLIAAGAAGEATGSIVATWEAEDYEKFGQVLHAFFNSGALLTSGGRAEAQTRRSRTFRSRPISTFLVEHRGAVARASVP